jgi:diazepam-binding inhibitor (GABA receptor modulating acyl-CoA-binding protein)
MEIEAEFKRIVALINDKKTNRDDTDNLTNENKLDLYKYFKQATEGDCNTAEPWSINFEASAKWKAWNSVKGMSKEDAMTKYVEMYNNYMV